MRMANDDTMCCPTKTRSMFGIKFDSAEVVLTTAKTIAVVIVNSKGIPKKSTGNLRSKPVYLLYALCSYIN